MAEARCDSVLIEEGSEYRCTLQDGHAGTHKNGVWEWHEVLPEEG